VDELWQAAILDTKLYADLQAALGLTLHYRPSGASDLEAEPREKRLTVMKAIYNAFFLTNPLGSDPSQPMRTQASAGLTESNIYIYVKTTTGETLTINISMQANIMELKRAIQEIWGIPPREQRLLYAGTLLEHSSTLEDYSIGNGFVLEFFSTTSGYLTGKRYS
jgi:Ubiquitin family